ncbi:Hypothetical_protein [Hexamita inflata]|uniref:Hypothetical_protein n=1 Tax=Hexamita inflata TaxID=28002 RepID=A0AA86RBN6_9EUKA|nr:Hypothetical protein HINF_LOCUS57667 [Hexamita inflata]
MKEINSVKNGKKQYLSEYDQNMIREFQDKVIDGVLEIKDNQELTNLDLSVLSFIAIYRITLRHSSGAVSVTFIFDQDYNGANQNNYGENTVTYRLHIVQYVLVVFISQIFKTIKFGQICEKTRIMETNSTIKTIYYLNSGSAQRIKYLPQLNQWWVLAQRQPTIELTLPQLSICTLTAL